MNITLLLRILLFLSVLFFFYRLFFYILKNNVIETSIRTFYQKTKERENDRKEKERRLNYEDGVQCKKPILNKIDLLIIYSNISRKLQFLNAELFLLCSISTSFLCSLYTWIITNSEVISMSVGALVLFSIFLALYILSGINYKRTEDSLLPFANLLENYSRTSDDIVYILSQVGPHMNEPLRTAIEECYDDCIRIGISKALNKLQLKIEHEKFKDIIRNIEISSRYEANYREVISGNRELLRDYLSAREKRKAILDNGRREILILIMVFLFMVYSLHNLLTIDLFHLLKTTFIGYGILIYCIVVLLLCTLCLLSVGKEK